MTDYKEAVIGRMVSEQGDPRSGIEVTVYDKDLIADDNLGSAVTDSTGKFRVDFTWSDFKAGEPLEGRPDIYVTYVDPKTGKKGKTEVVNEAEGKVAEGEDVEIIDLGDIVVG